MKILIALALAFVPAVAFAGNCVNHCNNVQAVVAQPVVQYTFVQPVRQVQFVEVPAQKIVVQKQVVAHHAQVQQVKVQRVQNQRVVQRSRSVTRVR
jgi:hypothetical protein